MERREAFEFHTPSSLMIAGPSEWQDGVYDQVTIRQPRTVWRSCENRVLLLRILARWVRHVEKKRSQIS